MPIHTTVTSSMHVAIYDCCNRCCALQKPPPNISYTNVRHLNSSSYEPISVRIHSKPSMNKFVHKFYPSTEPQMWPNCTTVINWTNWDNKDYRNYDNMVPIESSQSLWNSTGSITEWIDSVTVAGTNLHDTIQVDTTHTDTHAYTCYRLSGDVVRNYVRYRPTYTHTHAQ